MSALVLRSFLVSVPLPGFSGLRHLPRPGLTGKPECFSPVAGIQWVETFHGFILLNNNLWFQSRCRDSVG